MASAKLTLSQLQETKKVFPIGVEWPKKDPLQSTKELHAGM